MLQSTALWHGEDYIGNRAGMVEYMEGVTFPGPASIEGLYIVPAVLSGAVGDLIHTGGTHLNGINYVYGSSGPDTIHGGLGKDSIYGGIEDDLLYGGGGDDMIDAGPGADTVSGGVGSDTLVGQSGLDQIFGEAYMLGGTRPTLQEGNFWGDYAGFGAVGTDDDIYGGDGVDLILGQTARGRTDLCCPRTLRTHSERSKGSEQKK